jgi:hypothetical protein
MDIAMEEWQTHYPRASAAKKMKEKSLKIGRAKIFVQINGLYDSRRNNRNLRGELD